MTNDTSSSPLSLPEVTILPIPLNHPLPLHPSLPPPPPKVEIPVPMVESKLTASSCKIYVGNLPEITTVVDLQDCFGQIGECACALKRGFGFVDYKLPEHAAEAVAKYHEGHFLGAQIKVEISHAKSGAKSAPVNEEGRIVVRNPPGSDRPSDTRKPMHINGPPNAQFESSSRPPRRPYNAPFTSAPYPYAPPPFREDPYSSYGPPSVRYDRFDSYAPPAHDYDPYANRDYRYPPPPHQSMGRDPYYDSSYYPPAHSMNSPYSYYPSQPPFDRYNNSASTNNFHGGYGGGYDEDRSAYAPPVEDRGRRYNPYARNDARSPRERRSLSPKQNGNTGLPKNGRPVSPPLGGGLRDFRPAPVGREGEYNPRR